MIRAILPLLLGVLWCIPASALTTETDSLPDMPDGRPEDPAYSLERIMENITVSGYYRFFGWNRTMENPFRVIPSNQFANTPPYVIGVGDLYRDPPMILMNFGARPGGGTYIGMDWAFYSNFTGNPGASAINLNLGINLNGTATTDYGKFGFQLGGINWTNVSDFVFGSFQPYERFSIFERNPWEGASNSTERAQWFFDSGTVNRDFRFGMQAFKGILLDGYDLPGNVAFRVLYGKTPATASLEDSLPRFTLGGQLRRSFGKHELAYNTINYVLYTDELATNRGGIELHTLSTTINHDKFTIWGEGGVGRLYSVAQDDGWGEGGRLRFRTKKEWTRFPLEVELFYLDPKFVNYYGSFLAFNTTITEEIDDQQNFASGGGNGFFVGSITDVGQLSNNRQGFSVNAWFDLGEKTKINFGNMVARELETSSNRLSFSHRINGVTFSRFITFTNNTGPYGRWTSFFRGVSEDVFVTKVNEEGVYDDVLTFNTFQVQLKQAFAISGLPGFLFYVGSFGSASSEMQWVPAFNDKAYLRTHYHEIDGFLELTPWLDVALTYGIERIQANDQTNTIYYLDPEGNIQGANVEYQEGLTFEQYGIPDATPIPGAEYSGAAVPAQGYLNQNSTVFGAGLDVSISETAGLYFRHRRFRQLDENFGADDYTGSETTVELRIQF